MHCYYNLIYVGYFVVFWLSQASEPALRSSPQTI